MSWFTINCIYIPRWINSTWLSLSFIPWIQRKVFYQFTFSISTFLPQGPLNVEMKAKISKKAKKLPQDRQKMLHRRWLHLPVCSVYQRASILCLCGGVCVSFHPHPGSLKAPTLPPPTSLPDAHIQFFHSSPCLCVPPRALIWLAAICFVKQ